MAEAANKRQRKAKAVPSSDARKSSRTTVLLAPVIWDAAVEMMQRKGFNDNFSQYVADLIRRDQEQQLKEDDKD